MPEVIYNNDRRYPGPQAYPPPDEIRGLPTQEDLDAYPRMFTWGELKGIVKSGDLEQLMRNKAMQARYDEWSTGMKVKYGSTESYLTKARLPWKTPLNDSNPTYSPTQTTQTLPPNFIPDITHPTELTPSTNPKPHSSHSSINLSTPAFYPIGRGDVSNIATPGTSGTATPSSAGFVSLSSLKSLNRRLKATGLNVSTSSSHSAASSSSPGERGGGGGKEEEGDEGDEGDGEQAVYLKWDDEKGLDGEKYAVLPNDWPYNTPYGVRHYCVWSRVPIAHPELVNYSPEAWSRIESEGLGGFTGIYPYKSKSQTTSSQPSPTSVSPSQTQLLTPPPSSHAISSLNTNTPSQSTKPALQSTNPSHALQSTSTNPSHAISPYDAQGRAKFIGKLDDADWYAADIAYGGEEMRKWAGVEYECEGGEEVGRMVRGLWDRRGWECLWFVNPPRLQSVPGFSHFHVFARRKTPEEIDAAEAIWICRNAA